MEEERKKMEEEREKEKKKEKFQDCKSPTQRQRFITTKKRVTVYTNTPISKIETVQQK